MSNNLDDQGFVIEQLQSVGGRDPPRPSCCLHGARRCCWAPGTIRREKVPQIEPYGRDDLSSAATCEVVQENSSIVALSYRQRRRSVFVSRAVRQPSPWTSAANALEPREQKADLIGHVVAPEGDTSEGRKLMATRLGRCRWWKFAGCAR